MTTNRTHRLTEFALTITGSNRDQSSEKRSQKFELFRFPDGRVFADIYDGGIRQTWPILGKQFSQQLAQLFFELERKIATPSQLKATVNLIEAQAQTNIAEREVFMRVAELEGKRYIDLADEKWRAVEIDPAGWRVVDMPAVRFVRSPGMLPLPVPESGGSIDMLRSLINVSDEQHFTIVVAWLIAALHRRIQKPILAIRGGEGSAKSTLAEILRGLSDPYNPPYTATPATEDRLRSRARESYAQSFDNTPGMKGSMSDAFCRVVTDGTNQPMIINGISDVIMRPDFVDRSVMVDLAAIPDDRRRTRQDLMTAFEKARPQILGVLLDAVAHGLRTQAQLTPTALPRMADFALTVTACETVLWPSGTFTAAYDANRAEAVEAVIDADPVASSVRALIDRRTHWSGTATELDGLLRAITGKIDGWNGWPKEPRLLAGRLRELETSLMKVGVGVTFERSGHGRTRIIRIDSIGASGTGSRPISPSTASAPGGGGSSQKPPAEPPTNDTNRSPAPTRVLDCEVANARVQPADTLTLRRLTADVADAEISNNSVELLGHRFGKSVAVYRVRRRVGGEHRVPLVPFFVDRSMIDRNGFIKWNS